MDIKQACQKVFDKYPSATIDHDQTSNTAVVHGARVSRVKLLFGNSINVLTVDNSTSILLLDLL